MWAARVTALPDEAGRRFALERAGGPATFDDVGDALRADASFRTFLNALVADAPFEGVYFEAPPFVPGAGGRPFELVLLDAPYLARMRPDPGAFREHYGDAPVAAFENLSGDARLVAPRPDGPDGAYGHLAAFARLAPPRQRQALWRRVGEELQARVAGGPVWLNTEGSAVPWLHVRLDRRPKYVHHGPYRRLPDAGGKPREGP